jgi:hypothetical protein
MHNYALFVGALAVNVATLVVDGQTRGWISLLGVVVCLAASLWSISGAMSLQRWFDQSAAALVAWSSVLSVVVVTCFIGGMYRPFAPSDSLEAMTFFGGLQVVTIAIAVVIAAVGTSDVEDQIRLAPNRLRHSEHAAVHADELQRESEPSSP